MARIGMVGSGNVGANTAFFLAESGVSDILLYDIREGLSKGKALDMMEAAPIRSYRTRIAGTDSIDDLIGSEIILVAAGSVRKPGMRREELFSENVKIIEHTARWLDSAKKSSKWNRNSCVIVVTEPIDFLTTVLTTKSGMPRERVIGVGGILDSTRLRYAVARDLGLAVENVFAVVIGRHNEEMIAPSNYTSVSGVPILKLMHIDQFTSLVNETREAGDFIVDMARRSTAYYAPSAAISELAESVIRNSGRILSVSVLLKGEYGIDGVAMSMPAVIGEGGIKKILLPELSREELSALRESAHNLKAILKNSA
jgi:malate dehydrogenase